MKITFIHVQYQILISEAWCFDGSVGFSLPLMYLMLKGGNFRCVIFTINLINHQPTRQQLPKFSLKLHINHPIHISYYLCVCIFIAKGQSSLMSSALLPLYLSGILTVFPEVHICILYMYSIFYILTCTHTHTHSFFCFKGVMLPFFVIVLVWRANFAKFGFTV